MAVESIKLGQSTFPENGDIITSGFRKTGHLCKTTRPTQLCPPTLQMLQKPQGGAQDRLSLPSPGPLKGHTFPDPAVHAQVRLLLTNALCVCDQLEAGAGLEAEAGGPRGTPRPRALGIGAQPQASASWASRAPRGPSPGPPRPLPAPRTTGAPGPAPPAPPRPRRRHRGLSLIHI